MLVSASPVRPLMGTGRVGTSGITGVGAVERVVEVDVELDVGARDATERERDGPATGGGGMLPALPVAARERVEGPRRLAIVAVGVEVGLQEACGSDFAVDINRGTTG